MTTKLARIIKYGIQNFLRNSWLSFATTSIMVLALIIFHGLILFNVISDAAIVSLKDKIDISVYFKDDVSDEKITAVGKTIENLPEVKGVEYVSKEKALAVFRERHKDDRTITAALNELDENPLLASLNIKAQDPAYYSAIAKKLESEEFADIIESVTYNQNKLAIDRLASIINAFESIGFGLAVFIAAIAALITFNTIRLAIYSNREELKVMRLVGASSGFINGPFIVTGILYGIVGAFVSILVVMPIISAISPYINVFIPEMQLQQYFSENFIGLLGYQLLFGIALGSVSAAVAVRRYMKI